MGELAWGDGAVKRAEEKVWGWEVIPRQGKVVVVCLSCSFTFKEVTFGSLWLETTVVWNEVGG